MNYHSSRHTKFDVIEENKYVIILLKYLGIDILHKKRKSINLSFIISAYVVPVFHYLFYIERLFTFVPYIILQPSSSKLIIAYLLHSSAILISWNIFYLRKKQIGRSLKILQKKLEKIRLRNLPRRRLYFPLFSKFMVFIICIFPIPYGVAEWITLYQLEFLYLYNAEVNKNSFIMKVYFVFRGVAYSVERETFCGAVCFLYSLLCWRLCYSLQNYRLFLENSIAEKKYATIPKNFFANYILLLDAAEEVDSCLSLPMFSMTIVYGFSLFTLLVSSLTIVGGTFPAFSGLNIFTNIASTAVFLSVNVMAAAQVPLEVERNICLFFSFYEKSVKCPSKCNLSKKELKLLKIIAQRDQIVLSGCHVIYFSRSLLLTIVGILLTYGLLFMNFK